MTVQEAAGVLMRALDAGDVPMVATTHVAAALIPLRPPATSDLRHGAVFHTIAEDGSRFCVTVSGRGRASAVERLRAAQGAR